jgi:hypothetical protein
MTARLIAIAVMLSALIGAAWYVDSAAYERGANDVKEEVQKAADEAAMRNAAVQRKQLETLLESKNEQTKRLQIVSADHDRAVRELSGLRSAAGASRGGTVPSTTASTGADDPNPVADVLGHCGAELVRLARAADDHAADALMCTQAWPK